MTFSQNTIIKYIRRRNGKPHGVLIATKNDDNTYSVGWSLCNARDCWDKPRGLGIAFRRAQKPTRLFTVTDDQKLPHTVAKNLHDFINRCEKYFKGIPLKNS